MTVNVKCVHCGKPVLEMAVECPHCGKPVANKYAPTNTSPSPRTWRTETKKSSKIPFILIGICIIAASAAALHYLGIIKL